MRKTSQIRSSKTVTLNQALLSPTFLPMALLVLPWLNPLAYGPTHPVVQWLAVCLGASLCLMVWDWVQVSTPARIRTIAVAWLVAATVSAVMGLLQYLGLAEHFSPLVNYVELGQAYANLRQRNQLATLLSIGLAALLWWQARVEAPFESNSSRPALRALFGLGAMLLVAADAASGSRTGLLQLILLLALAFVWRRGRVTLVMAVLGYALAALLLPHLAGLDPQHSGILGRIGESSDPCASRFTLWSNVLHLIAQKPLLGWGWGELDYAHFDTLYSGARFCEILGNAHNLPLHIAVELGVPIAMLLCGPAIGLVWRGKPWAEQDATRQMAWSVLAVIGLHSMLEYPLWYGPFQLAAVLAIWILWRTRSHVAVAGMQAPHAWQWSAAIVAILVCTYAAWDYWRISQIYLPVSQRAAIYQENTLEKIQTSTLFQSQVQFAELGITPLTADNAKHLHALAKDLLHFSPEPMVVEKVIDSARLLGDDDAVRYYSTRYQAAFPAEFAAWRKKSD